MSTPQKDRPGKGFNLTRLLLILGLGLLLCGEGYYGYQLHELSKQQEQLKKDYSAMNNITYGLFNVDQWHDEIAGIITRQVRNFSMNKEQKRELQKEVEQIIYALINKTEAMLTQSKKKSVKGKLVKFAVKNFVDIDTIRSQVPSYAKMIIAKVDNPSNKKQLSKMAMKKLADVEQSAYFDSTKTVYSNAINKVYRKYHVSTADDFNTKVTTSLKNIEKKTYSYSTYMLLGIVVVLMLWWFFRKKTELHATLFVMSLLFAFTLLAVGLTASMIEVDARINSLDFVLLGEHVVFKNQVLFFESKSILDVVTVLISQSAIDSVLVGVLILIFSILFPVMKLSSTGIHLLAKKKLAENKVIKYFAFQSGKWSMADVIVIAILMAYIGLNGLLESQLARLNISSSELTIISTHNTALQPGYIIFISFVLFGLVLSTILKFITPHDAS